MTSLHECAWIIPAYAGNTPGRRERGLVTGDHPRIRGEHERLLPVVVDAVGIIPAYAGNTLGVAGGLGIALGSSPHTRGTLPLAHVRDGSRGIIPAYAGNTLIYLRSQFPAWQFCITSSKATGLVPLACIAPA